MVIAGNEYEDRWSGSASNTVVLGETTNGIVEDLGILEGRYQLVREMGRGGMGRIYEAFDLTRKRSVAAKIMLNPSQHDEAALLRFYQESAILCTLKHPNIVEVHAAFAEEDEACLIMELLDGRSLRQVLLNESMGRQRIKHLIAQVLEGLAYAHGRSIIHRDIKPDNIMVADNDHVKITDFGIARLLQGGVSMGTASDVLLGTPMYCAPEQIEGQNADERTDLYALGVVIYEMVTGKPPFEGSTPLSIAFKHVHTAPQPPSRVGSDVPEEWESFILKTLAKHPAERFQTAREMAEALSALPTGDDEPVPRRHALYPEWDAGKGLWSEQPLLPEEDPFPEGMGRQKGDSIGDVASLGQTIDLPAGTPSTREQIRAPVHRWNLGPWALACLALLIAAIALGRSLQQSGAQDSLPGLTVQATVLARNSDKSGHHVATDTKTTGIMASSRARAIVREPALLSGPQEGTLTASHPTEWARLSVRDFEVRAQFSTPAKSEVLWDFGFMFRNTERGGQYRLAITGDRRYELILHDMTSQMRERILMNGPLSMLKVTPGSTNTLLLMAQGKHGWLLVNGTYAASFDLSGKLDYGDVGAGIQLPMGGQYRGPVHFTHFSVSALSP